eukprot:gene12912-biopygen9949
MDSRIFSGRSPKPGPGLTLYSPPPLRRISSFALLHRLPRHPHVTPWGTWHVVSRAGDSVCALRARGAAPMSRALDREGHLLGRRALPAPSLGGGMAALHPICSPSTFLPSEAHVVIGKDRDGLGIRLRKTRKRRCAMAIVLAAVTASVGGAFSLRGSTSNARSLRPMLAECGVNANAAERQRRILNRTQLPERRTQDPERRTQLSANAAERRTQESERRTQDPEHRTQLNAHTAEDAVFSCLRLHLSSVFGCLRPS